MKLKSAIVGSTAGPFEQHIDDRWLMAYSAGLGETDPRYYDTAAGVRVHPLFPVCYEWPSSVALREQAVPKPLHPLLVHAEHDLTLHRAARAGETLRVTASVASIVQRRAGAHAVMRFETRDAAGAPVSASDFGVIYRGVEVEGGDRPPAATPAASAPAALEPCGEIAVAANLGHVYTECARIWNPIHTDPAYARAAGLPGIILHGTATLALSVSKVVSAFVIDATRIRRIRCRFTGMVLMPSMLSLRAARDGATLHFETWCEGKAVLSGRLLLQ